MRTKQRIFAGATCDQIVYSTSERAKSAKSAKPVLRFNSDTEREEFNRRISRRRHARKFNEAFSPSSLYSTLTFDLRHEVHTFPEAKRVRDNLWRRLLRAYPEAKIALYMGRGVSTDRIHFHMVSDGIPAEFIASTWSSGEVIRIVHLREHNYYNNIDCGQDYSGLANYLFDHWTPEQGKRSHRYKMTANIISPVPEEKKEAKRKYSEKNPPRAPKGYIYVSCEATKYGYYCFHYVKKPPDKGKRRRAEKSALA